MVKKGVGGYSWGKRALCHKEQNLYMRHRTALLVLPCEQASYKYGWGNPSSYILQLSEYVSTSYFKEYIHDSEIRITWRKRYGFCFELIICFKYITTFSKEMSFSFFRAKSHVSIKINIRFESTVTT